MSDVFEHTHLNTVNLCSFTQGMKALPDKCANLIIADPPYFQIKGDFDFCMTRKEWEQMHVELAESCKRVLADNGSLFLWGHAKNIAYQQVIFDSFFKLENSMIWEKRDCQTLRNDFDALRAFAPVTERLLFYSNGTEPEEWDMTGTEMMNANNECFWTLKVFFDDWLEASGLTYKQAVQEIGSTASHWFGFSKKHKTQFSFPTREKWEIMNRIKLLGIEYEDLRKEYEDLRKEYEDLRRPFSNTRKLTDVLNYSQESHISRKYDHPTIKPEKLTSALIETCTRPGDLVVVPFAGSGTECAMTVRAGRDFIAYDTNPKYVKMAQDRANIEISQPCLFYV